MALLPSSGGRVLRRLVALVALGTVLAPLLALLGQVAVALPAVGEEGAVLALPTGRRLTLLARGGSLAVAVALAGMALGALAGTALWRLPARARRLVRVGVWVAAFVPSYVHSLAWTAAAGEVQRLLGGLGLPRVPLRGWGMAWWVQLMALAPLAVGLALAGLESLDREAIDAARPLRSDAAVLARVALPMAAPLVAAGGALLFVLALTDYAVPSLFQVGVYAMEILTEFSANHDPVRASLVSMPLLALAAVAVGGALRLLPRVPQRPQAPGDVWVVAPRWPRWLRALQGAALAILAAQIVVPLATLAPLAAAEPDLAGALYAARREIARSLAVAVAAAVVSLPVALALGPFLARRRRTAWGWLLVAAPAVVPAPLVAVGLITLWNRPGLDAVYTSSAMPILAAVVRFAPLAAGIVAAQWRRLDPALLDVARVLAPRPRQVVVQVLLPLLAPGCLAAMGVVFVLTLGELGATLLVAPPGRSTLTLRIYNYLHYGAAGDVAGLCLVMLAMAVLAGLAAVAALEAWGRLLPGREGAAS